MLRDWLGQSLPMCPLPPHFQQVGPPELLPVSLPLLLPLSDLPLEPPLDLPFDCPFEASWAPPPGARHSRRQWPGLPQLLHVELSVLPLPLALPPF